MKTLFTLFLSLCYAQAQLVFEQAEQSLELDPSVPSVEVSFPFTASSDTELIKQDIFCGCLTADTANAQWKSETKGALKFTLDTTNIKGTTRKDVTLKFKNQPEQTLSILASIPQVLTLEPKSHIWKKGEELASKSFIITVHSGYTFNLTQASASHHDFSMEFSPLAEENGQRQFRLTVTPPVNADKKLINVITISTDSTIPRYQSFRLLTIVN